IDERNPHMSRHIHFESHLSPTGASADERFTHRPSETGAVALAILAGLDGSVTAPNITDTKLKHGIEVAVQELKANQGKALVVCGSNDKNVQLIVNAINNAVGAYGTTIDWSRPVNYRAGIDKDLVDLIAQMEGGQVGTLMIYGANPVYNFFDGERFAKALSKVKVTVSFSEKFDETTQLCAYNLPAPHYLESWGDAEPRAGVISFIQPTIYPLFKTRPFQTSLLRWSGNNQDYDTYQKNYWMGRLGSEEAYNKALQEGIFEEAAAGGGSFSGGGVAVAAQALSATAPKGATEVVLYEKVGVGNGSGATNPWLQELPDPITKASWDNYAMISMAKADELGVNYKHMDYEYYPTKPVFEFKVGNKSVELPILVIPGMNANTIAIAVGYGRNEKLGRTAAGVGKNVYPFASFNGSTINYYATNVEITDKNRKQKIAQSQIHNSYEGRVEVVRETTMASFMKNPNKLPEYRKDLAKKYSNNTGNYRKEGTLYPEHSYPGIKWGMAIDMNACYGCGACVVACHIENNVPVVGKNEVARFHDMHWLRIDRYFVSAEGHPDELKGVVFQPMLCQHCDNAPCENVCPVAATNHSS